MLYWGMAFTPTSLRRYFFHSSRKTFSIYIASFFLLFIRMYTYTFKKTFQHTAEMLRMKNKKKKNKRTKETAALFLMLNTMVFLCYIFIVIVFDIGVTFYTLFNIEIDSLLVVKENFLSFFLMRFASLVAVIIIIFMA